MKFTFVRKILTFLDQHQRYQSILLIFSMLLASLAELFGLGMVLLIINSFLGINNNIELGFLGTFLNDYFGSQNSYNDLYSILFLFFLVFTLKFFLFVFVAWTESDFVAEFREKISYKLYNNFLNRELSNLLKKNSAEYLRNFTEEISNCVLFYHSIIKIILDLIIFLAFVVFLLVYNPAVSTLVIAFFSLIGITYYFSIKNKILNSGNVGRTNLKSKLGHIFSKDTNSALYFYKLRTMCNKLLYVDYAGMKESKYINENYPEYLSKYCAAIATGTYYPVIKYFEIPAAGCLTFMEMTEKNDGCYLGFKDGETSIFMNEKNYKKKFEEFLNDPDNKKWQEIASAGREHVMSNLTNEKAVNRLVNLMRELI